MVAILKDFCPALFGQSSKIKDSRPAAQSPFGASTDLRRQPLGRSAIPVLCSITAYQVSSSAPCSAT